MSGAAVLAVSLAGTVFGAPEPLFPERPPAVSPRTVSVDVGGHPGRIALGETGLWVTVYGGRGGNRVVRIDRAAHRVTARVPVRGGPFQIATGAGAVWVTGNFDRGDDVLYRIDPRRERVVATIPLPGDYAGALAADRRGTWVVTTSRHGSSSSLVEVDPSTNGVVRTTPLREANRRWVTALALARGDVWLLALKLGRRGERPGDVLRFDPRAGRVTARIGAEALTMGVGPGGLWTTGCLDCGVHRSDYFAQRADMRSAEPVGPRVAVRRLGFGPLSVRRERVWFGGYEDARETIAFSLDPKQLRIDHLLQLGSVLHTGMAVDADGHRLWVALAIGDVLRLDLPRR
jgi:hypothetical protein